jgi:TolB-like protein
MRARVWSWILLCCIVWPLAAAAGQPDEPAEPAAGERIEVAVTEFVSKGGIDQQRMDALSDMLANQIREMGPFRVIGMADIRSALQLEQQKRLLGCTDDSCLAEVGGALGVRYMVAGNVSRFGQTWLLNLKLLDVEQVEVTKGLSRSITGAIDVFIQALPQAAHDLMQAVPGVELHGDGQVERVDGGRPRTAAGWFVDPGGRGGDFQLGLALGAMVAPPIYLGDETPSQEFKGLEQFYSAGLVNLTAGYNATSWLTVGLRLGGTFGGTRHDRSRHVAEAAISLQGAMMSDSWFQPVAYFELGAFFMRDEGELVCSESGQVEPGQNLESAGLVGNLGIGFNAFVSPRWYLGGRLGGAVRGHIAMSHSESDAEATECTKSNRMVRVSKARAFEIGVTLALVTGYEF